MSQNVLLCEIARFNWLPVNYTDHSWLEQWLSVDQLAAIRSNAAASRTLNQFLLDDGEPIDEIQVSAFSDPILQLFLLPAEALRRLVILVGLMLHHRQIKGIISGARQRELIATFGETAYEFALHRAGFILGSLGYPLGLLDCHQKDFEWHVHQSGMLLLGGITRNLPSSCRRRLEYNFPRKHAELLRKCWQNIDNPDFATDYPDVTKIPLATGQRLFLKTAQELNIQWKPVLV